jgi:cell division protein ZapE
MTLTLPLSLGDAYQQRLDGGWLEDAAQENAVTLLSSLLNVLRVSPSKPPKGLYLHGPVGRGKSQLLDMFLQHLGDVPSRRTHMHAFMQEVHQRLNQIRGIDPIQQIARELASQCTVLGFDEFYVTNIADGMLLGRLFEHLFKHGVVVVATSNWPIEELFQDGRNRKAFLPFIRLLKHHLQAIDLGDGQDYRRPEDPAWPLYVLTPPSAEPALQAFFDRYAVGEDTRPPATIAAHAFRGRCGWYRFDDICRRALGRAEYTQLMHHVETLLVEGVPRFGEHDSDAALRLVTLIDICYEHRRRVIVSAPAYPDELYVAGPVRQAFQRVASRLAEMQTWLEDPIPPAL